MAKKSVIARNIKRKQLSQKYSSLRVWLKSQIKRTPNLGTRLRIHALVQSLPKNSSPVRTESRCQLTGRPKAVYRDFGLSRHVFREMVHEGLLPGVVKSSW
uniref:Small ribosomal subunit protein uS14c n=1 Tax=Chloropicon mariensis TaxID=1606511 RepID=A0A4D6C4B5_9CHLO|nr:ribosomal protein S14 [Chloropicon mariensis]QBX97869.1 ribosomal protein S14 [Chloropicon mariensis]UQK95254.1 ribosomal protein S14 [Chloropicon mariensis]|mmetsp:Transcript_12507/g.23516  ORF Transcript_12507/g.23516 Transcript_12507/m.23516 type:complete len:101 (-) Transcript_12507:647-949(-)